MKTKKSLGQHFLRSERALNKIVETGEVKPTDTILEIGPGQGALTEKLLATGAKVIAIEKDKELFEFLKQKFGDKLTLIHDDILNFKLEIENYKLISNIPYNITGAILKKFLGADNKPERMVLLVQKEVAKRILAKDGKESVLSISVKAYGKPYYIETVKAGSFVPVPKVDSAIISITDIKPFDNEKTFFKVLRAGFASKRKKLSSNLAIFFKKEAVQRAFQKLNLSENIRAEDVSVENWQKLATLLDD